MSQRKQKTRKKTRSDRVLLDKPSRMSAEAMREVATIRAEEFYEKFSSRPGVTQGGRRFPTLKSDVAEFGTRIETHNHRIDNAFQVLNTICDVIGINMIEAMNGNIVYTEDEKENQRW